MEVNDMKLSDLLSLLACFQNKKVESQLSNSPWEIGKIYLIRTVTMIDTGRLVEVHEHELILEDAAWIPDTGRFADAVEQAKFSEVEPFPSGRVIIGRGSIIDAVQIKAVSRSQK